MEQFLKFHGTDWAGMIFGLLSTYYLGRKKRWGFVFGVVGGIAWIIFGVLTQSAASIMANVLFIVFNCRGFFRWKKTSPENTA
jgi:nicotinamide riboside transporter PnuC